jgi:hypothetical protein
VGLLWSQISCTVCSNNCLENTIIISLRVNDVTPYKCYRPEPETELATSEPGKNLKILTAHKLHTKIMQYIFTFYSLTHYVGV